MGTLHAHFLKAAPLFQAVLLLHVAAFLAYLASLGSRSRGTLFHRAAWALFALAVTANLAQLLGRGLEAGRPPFKTYYESSLYFAALLGPLVLVVERIKRAPLLGAASLAVLTAVLLFALGKADVEIVPLPPALRSAWFLPHVTFYVLGYACVTVAFLAGLLALAKPGERTLEEGSFWSRALGYSQVDFGAMNRTWVRAGVLFLAFGLVTGGVWATFAWSDYWAWDPKENWGLLSWLVYLAVLHMHHVPRFKGRPAILASVVAWGLVLFTYFGMAALPTKRQSMHVYTEPPAKEDARDVKGVNPAMY